MRVGRDTRIASGNKFYDIHVTIGDAVWIGPDVIIVSCSAGPITIGNRVDIAPKVLLESGKHLIRESNRSSGSGTGSEIKIRDGTWIGAGSIILAAARIGKGCIVEAGSVVLEGIYPNIVLFAGNPAVEKNNYLN